MTKQPGMMPRTALYGLLVAMAACQASPEALRESRGGVTVESVFAGGEHGLKACLKEYGASLTEMTDGVLFFDRDSKVRLTPPRGERLESYHVHLLHRVGGEVLDYVVRQDAAGRVELDLSRFDQPEKLVIASSSFRFADETPKASGVGQAAVREAVTPPYAMSFALVSADQAEAVIARQSFRYDVETEQGKLALFVQPFNRRDMLITWVDPEKRLGTLIKEDPYIYLRAEDGYVPPRITAEVLTAKGALWARTGTWHLPESVARGGRDEKPFSFRIHAKELIAFGAPARVDYAPPKEPVTTTARLEAKFSGLAKGDALRLVLAAQVPTPGRKGETTFRVQTHDVGESTKGGSYVLDLSDLDASRFPLTSGVAHRFVQPWKLSGGFLNAQPPRGRAILSLKDLGGPGKLHARVVAPRYASHYDFVSFLGAGSTKGDGDSLARAFSGVPGSPNVAPPPVDPMALSLQIPPAGPSQPFKTPSGDTVAGGGGKASNCGCGPGPAPGMPSPGCPSKHKCKGQCGQACPGNGHCKDDKESKVTVEFPCPPSPKGCQQDRATGKCKCGPHPWNKDQAMAAVTGLFPGAADYSWFGLHNGWAPCDEATPIGRVRVSFWAAAGFGMTHVWCGVSAAFGPCKGDPPQGVGPGGGPIGGGGPNPGGPNGGLGGGTGTGGTSLPAATMSGVVSLVPTSTHPVGLNDPNTMVKVDRISDALGARGSLNTGFLLYDEATLASVLSDPASSIAEAYQAAHQNTVATSMANADTELNLPFFLEGLLEAVGGGGTPGGSPPPGGGIPPLPPGCGALGIEFILGVSLLSALLRRICR